MKLHILFSDRTQLLLEGIPDDVTIKDLKLEIQKRVPELRRMFLRLIFSGRILDDVATLRQSEIADSSFIHCASSQESTGKGLKPQMVPTQGFDRLRESGFTEEDIQNIRNQFHEETGEEDDGSTRMREREEEWMNSMGSSQQEDNSEISVYSDMVYGLTLGFLFGFLMLFFLKHNIFRSKQQTGIIIGVVVNLTFGLLRWTS